MSSRTAVALLCSLLGALPAAAGGCSSDDGASPVSPDAAADGGPEANRPAPPEPDPGAPATCRERCVAAHPAAVAKDEAIDACWKASCARTCIEGAAAPVDDAGTDADADAPDAGACASPVVTISEACDACTSARCCAPWDACFQDPDCAALEACYQDCFTP